MTKMCLVRRTADSDVPYCWTIEALHPRSAGLVLGYLHYTSSRCLVQHHRGIFVRNLYVEAAWRKSGIGTLLLAELLRAHPRCSVLEGHFMPYAYAFWRKYGRLNVDLPLHDPRNEWLTVNRHRVLRASHIKKTIQK